MIEKLIISTEHVVKLLLGSFLLLINSWGFSQVSKAPVIWTTYLKGDFNFYKDCSIQCNAWCYEWAGTKTMLASRRSKDSVICQTSTNEATHCSLNIVISGDSCLPEIYLYSITPNGSKIFPYQSGHIEIDKNYRRRNILKASFSFDFINDENDKRIFWEGKIFARIHNRVVSKNRSSNQ